jgi:hypothetical protein
VKPFKIGVLLVALLAFSAGPLPGGVRLGGISVGVGYSSFNGYPYYYGFAPYYGNPWFNWWGSFYYPSYYTGFLYQPNMGEVKLRTSQKTAIVLIDGSYAGTADKLKTMWLEPGSYQFELRDGPLSFSQKIYVLSGKTLTVNAALGSRGAKP